MNVLATGTTLGTLDNSEAITHLSLCAGYGGIDLGIKRVLPPLLTVAYSEIEAFAIANLVSKMEAGLLDVAPVCTNLKTFPWLKFRGRIRLLTGGYPCQPFSSAGLRLGADDPRYLWPYILTGIKVCLPDMCFFENVEGHITLGLRQVLFDLESAGYQATWGLFSASEVGAPHQRKRIFIMAHRIGAGLEIFTGNGAGSDESRRIAPTGRFDHGAIRLPLWPSGPGEAQHGWEPPRTVGDSNSQRKHEREGIIGEQRGRTEDSGDEVGNSEGERAFSEKQSRQSHDSQCASEAVVYACRGSRNNSSESGRLDVDGTVLDQSGRSENANSPDRSGEAIVLFDTKSERSGALGHEHGHARKLQGGSEGLGWPDFPVCFRCSKSIYWDAPRGCGCELRPEDGCDICGTRIEECRCELEYASNKGQSQRTFRQENSSRQEQESQRSDGNSECEAEPALGRNSDGYSHRLDTPELYITSDNRTDELRLCGNGVVPASAAKAFRTLLARILSKQTK